MDDDLPPNDTEPGMPDGAGVFIIIFGALLFWAGFSLGLVVAKIF